MFERVDLQTKYKSTDLKQLLKLAELHDEEAVNAVLLQSVYSGRAVRNIDEKEAYFLASRYIKVNPEHVFSRYIIGLYENNVEELQKVANSGNKNLAACAAAALYDLNIISIELKNKIDAHVYASFSLANSGTNITRKFLDGQQHNPNLGIAKKLGFLGDVTYLYGPRSSRAMFECEFITAVLLGKKFNDFDQSIFVQRWDAERQRHLIRANNSVRAIQDLDDDNSDVAWVLNDAICHDHDIVDAFFKRARELKLIPDDLYLKLMNFLAIKTHNQHVRDKISYELYLHYIQQNDLTAARQYLTTEMLSARFTGFQLNDFAALLVRDQVKLAYCRFKELVKSGAIEQAIDLLDKINKLPASTGYDADAFAVFAQADPRRENYKYFQVLRETAYKLQKWGKTADTLGGDENNILANDVLAYARSLYENELNPIQCELRCQFNDLIRQVHAYKAKEELDKEFLAGIAKLQNDAILTGEILLPSKQEWLQLHNKFGEVITMLSHKPMSIYEFLFTKWHKELYDPLLNSLAVIRNKMLHKFANPFRGKEKPDASHLAVAPGALISLQPMYMYDNIKYSLPAYLSSAPLLTNPDNLSLYQKHDFNAVQFGQHVPNWVVSSETVFESVAQHTDEKYSPQIIQQQIVQPLGAMPDVELPQPPRYDAPAIATNEFEAAAQYLMPGNQQVLAGNNELHYYELQFPEAPRGVLPTQSIFSVLAPDNNRSAAAQVEQARLAPS